jgi:hypothetical protein
MGQPKVGSLLDLSPEQVKTLIEAARSKKLPNGWEV